MTERVRITSPRTAGRRSRPSTGTEEIDAQTSVGEVYMRSLMRSQLRVAIVVFIAIGVGIGGLPLLFWFAPDATSVDVFGVPLAWLVLGVAVYPTLVVAGWLYVRQAERNERQFTELVERRGDGAASGVARDERSGERDRVQSEERAARRARPDSTERREQTSDAARPDETERE